MFEDTIGKKTENFTGNSRHPPQVTTNVVFTDKMYGPLNYLNERNVTQQNVSLENSQGNNAQKLHCAVMSRQRHHELYRNISSSHITNLISGSSTS